MKKYVLIAVLLFSSLPFANAEVVLYSWDFETSGNTEGWQPTHDLSSFAVNNGVLITESTGTDPYMHSPLVSFDARAYPYLRICMKVSAGTMAEFFWQLEGMANDEAGYEQPFDIVADDNFHVYLIYLGAHEKWTGTVKRLRLDPTTVAGASIEIDYIQVLSIGPGLEIKHFGSDVLLPEAGISFNLECVIENTGDEEVQDIAAQLTLAQGLQILEGDSLQNLSSLAPKETHTFSWPVIADSAGEYASSVQVQAENVPYTLESQTTIVVDSSPFAFPVEIPQEVQVYPFDPHYWILENSNLRLVFEHLSNFRFYAVKEGEWFLLGTSRPISILEFQVNDQHERVELLADSLQVLYASPDSAAIQLTGQFLDDGDGLWTFSFEFALARQANHVAARYRLCCSQPRNLLLFTGPSIYLGEGSFEEDFDEAILPGLEWLIAGERSSSTLDAWPPYNLRFAPHPLKLTAPIMAVNSQGITAGLFWDAYQKWDGSHMNPAIEFAVPNWLENQKNHKLSLMIPSIPEYIAENHEYATEPYPLQADDTLSISAHFYARESQSALDGFDDYFAVYGKPRLQPLARSLDEEVALCRDGFQTVWSDSLTGWQHAVGWDYSPFPGFAYLQYLDAVMTNDSTAKATLKERVKKVVNLITFFWGESGLVGLAGTHIAGWQLPFFVGHVSGAINGMKSQADGILNFQHPNGGWPFVGDTTLGRPGQYELGTCAQNTFLLLYAYQITGDERYWQGAKKALQFMQTFRVPRGAQTWEVPLHTPDILAAGHAVRAFATAYRINQDPTYLDQARYWARAGWPFVYFWADPEIETMPFATIPVLGATRYTYPWFGLPVPWNGLVYSHALFELSEVDPQPALWRRIAEGITRSAMFMQRTQGEYRGTYPDAWNLIINAPQPVYINPEDIIKNVLFLTGWSPELDNVIIEAQGKRLHITSGARIKNVTFNSSNSDLNFKCEFFRAETCYVLIVGLDQAPAKVLANNVELGYASNVDFVPQGWTYTDNDYLILKFIQPDDSPVSIKIEGMITGMESSQGNDRSLAARFYLRQNYPNPFRIGREKGTTIQFRLPKRAHVKIRIYDVRGRLISTLVNEKKEPGIHRVQWNGTDMRHVPVASGLYLCRFEAGGKRFLRKIVVIK